MSTLSYKDNVVVQIGQETAELKQTRYGSYQLIDSKNDIGNRWSSEPIKRDDCTLEALAKYAAESWYNRDTIGIIIYAKGVKVWPVAPRLGELKPKDRFTLDGKTYTVLDKNLDNYEDEYPDDVFVVDENMKFNQFNKLTEVTKC